MAPRRVTRQSLAKDNDPAPDNISSRLRPRRVASSTSKAPVRRRNTNKALDDSILEAHSTIMALVEHHCGVVIHEYGGVFLSPTSRWRHSDHHIDVPIKVKWTIKSVSFYMLRLYQPGSLDVNAADEQLAGEIGTHARVESERRRDASAPTVPYINGFGFSDGSHYSHANNCKLSVWVSHTLHRLWHWILRRPGYVSKYTSNPIDCHLPTPYVLVRRWHSDVETKFFLSTLSSMEVEDVFRDGKILKASSHE